MNRGASRPGSAHAALTPDRTDGRVSFVGESDEALLERFRGGQRPAFDELVRRHRTAIFNFILRSVRHHQTAEEIFQDTWLRIVQGARDFQGASKFTTWAYTVARNLCIDHSRKAALRKHPSLDEPAGHRDSGEGRAPADVIADPKAQVDRSAIGHELQRRLTAAIDALPADQREVFMLREHAGMAFKEIADIVGAPENTVKSRMRYALERLQQSLVEYEDYARALG